MKISRTIATAAAAALVGTTAATLPAGAMPVVDQQGSVGSGACGPVAPVRPDRAPAPSRHPVDDHPPYLSRAHWSTW